MIEQKIKEGKYFLFKKRISQNEKEKAFGV